MIILFKLLTGVYDSNIACHLVKPNNFVTIGHHLRLYKRHVHNDLCQYFFGNRILSNWNSLPDYVVLLTQLVYLRKDLINFAEIKHVFFIIQPTEAELEVEVKRKFR
jgi:hypothetical protein